jgi:hypothetical protein
MVSSQQSRIVQDVPCPCRQWHWRKLHTSGPGFSATDDYCRKCKRRMLLVFRVASFAAGWVAVIPLETEDAVSLRRTLDQIPGASPEVVEELLQTALAAANGPGHGRP